MIEFQLLAATPHLSTVLLESLHTSRYTLLFMLSYEVVSYEHSTSDCIQRQPPRRDLFEDTTSIDCQDCYCRVNTIIDT